MIWVRAPNHLGDGVMALPAIEALAAGDRVVVGAPPWGPALYGHLGVELRERHQVPSADAAVLFPPSFRVAWEARRLPRRVGFRGELRGWLLTDALPWFDGHRGDHYAALARVLGAQARGAPALPRPQPDPDVPEGHVALIPVSPSGPPVMWPGFQELASRLDEVVVYLGPGERWVEGWPTRAGLDLPALMACLVRARVVVSNDSGVSHLARALGLPTVVVHGSTTSARTGAHGSVAVEGPEMPCRPCYRKRCRVGGQPCLDVPVERVLRAVEAA